MSATDVDALATARARLNAAEDALEAATAAGLPTGSLWDEKVEAEQAIRHLHRVAAA